MKNPFRRKAPQRRAEPWSPNPYLPDGSVAPGSNRAAAAGGGAKRANPRVHKAEPPRPEKR